MSLSSRQLNEMATILRDLDLIVWQLERSPADGIPADARGRLVREVEALRQRLADLSGELGV